MTVRCRMQRYRILFTCSTLISVINRLKSILLPSGDFPYKFDEKLISVSGSGLWLGGLSIITISSLFYSIWIEDSCDKKNIFPDDKIFSLLLLGSCRMIHSIENEILKISSGFVVSWQWWYIEMKKLVTLAYVSRIGMSRRNSTRS